MSGKKQHFWEKKDICGSLNLVSLFQYFFSFFLRHFLSEADQGVTGGLIVAKAKPYCHHEVQPHVNYWYHYSYSYYCFWLCCHFFTVTSLIWIINFLVRTPCILIWVINIIILSLIICYRSSSAAWIIDVCLSSYNKPSLYSIIYTQFLLSPHSLMIMNNNNNKPSLYTQFLLSIQSLMIMLINNE